MKLSHLNLLPLAQQQGGGHLPTTEIPQPTGGIIIIKDSFAVQRIAARLADRRAVGIGVLHVYVRLNFSPPIDPWCSINADDFGKAGAEI
jgi:hypothetical protein